MYDDNFWLEIDFYLVDKSLLCVIHNLIIERHSLSVYNFNVCPE